DDNECVGCRLVKEALPGFGYSQNDIKTVSDMILATEIPQNPKTKLAEILCDADLDYLGRDDFIPISEKLRKELSAHGKSFSNVEWIRFEIAFLEGHEYFTKSERESRNPVKQMNLERLKLEIVKASPNISRNS
ncbi:MAG: phosphohydrolase, partial [Kiritimatiellaeota bacterium]|nr:phosphohydrolase [Kiritimatiellota bacterium]